MKKIVFFVNVCLIFAFLNIKANQNEFKKIDLRPLDKVLAEKGRTISDPKVKQIYGNIIREMVLNDKTVKNIDYRERESVSRNSIDNILIVEEGYVGQIYLYKNDYRFRSLDREIISTQEYSIYFAFIGFLLFLIYYILDNYLVKADKEIHQVFLILLGGGIILIAAALIFSIINHLIFSTILGLISIFISVETWKKDSWFLFFLNISVVIGFLFSLYFLK